MNGLDHPLPSCVQEYKESSHDSGIATNYTTDPHYSSTTRLWEGGKGRHG